MSNYFYLYFMLNELAIGCVEKQRQPLYHKNNVALMLPSNYICSLDKFTEEFLWANQGPCYLTYPQFGPAYISSPLTGCIWHLVDEKLMVVLQNTNYYLWLMGNELAL